MADELEGKRVAFLVSNEGVEERELTEPWEAVRRAGGRPELLATDGGDVQCFEHLDRVSTATVDATTDHADPADYDALVLPGGVANADNLRQDPHAVRFVHRVLRHRHARGRHLPRARGSWPMPACWRDARSRRSPA